MAKSIYKIPTSISRSRLDHEITIEAWDVSTKPLPVKSILYFFASAFFLAWAVLQSPFADASIFFIILFIIWFITAAVFFGRRTKTNEMVFQRIPALLNYAPKSRRTIYTRQSSRPFDFLELTGIKSIEDSGIIYFLDGSVGQMYSVVGSASYLLFDGDRNQIVNRVDNFFRKVDTKTEFMFLTNKEPQRVYKQLRSIEQQRERLRQRIAYKESQGLPTVSDYELMDLLDEKYDITHDDVGGKFHSVHQYLVLKAPSMDVLEASHKLLQSEVEGSSIVFSECVLLNKQATLDVMQSLYRKPDMV